MCELYTASVSMKLLGFPPSLIYQWHYDSYSLMAVVIRSFALGVQSAHIEVLPNEQIIQNIS